jgi:hypothetical protein
MIYGHDGTFHQTNEVNIEKDDWGNIVSVWFRCATLPFTVRKVRRSRADEMIELYNNNPPPKDSGNSL